MSTKKNTTKEREQKKEKSGLRAYVGRLFGKYDFRDERQFVQFGKWLIFFALLLVEIFVVLHQVTAFEKNGGWERLLVILLLEVGLTLFETIKIFFVQHPQGRWFFCLFNLLVAGSFLFLGQGVYALVVYFLVLTGFYIGVDKKLPAFILFAIGVFVYGGCYAFEIYLTYDGAVDVFSVITGSLAVIFSLFVHFIVVQVGLAFYRQFLRLDKALKQLDTSNKELEKAYAVVAEVTALEERQRIAKDIHDTAGHSITTVIMQTESAKLIIDENPAEAKKKLISANLQAKHALEELRDSVHLLSGSTASKTLKAELENIIHESTDGTNIVIRSDIDDIHVSPARHRFLCNSLKEGISNGLRHGGATAFWFECKQKENEIQFLLSDNGKGAGKNFKAGFGLKSMAERAKALGGEAQFRYDEEEGFEILLTIQADKEKRV